MSVEILDGKTIRQFVEDEPAFNAFVERHFASLDTDHDGVLSFTEMAKELTNIRLLEVHFGIDGNRPKPEELDELYRGIYKKFDRDGDENVDLEDFRAEMKEVLLAVAEGMGFMPVHMVVEEGSFLRMAVEKERADL
ncbi:uncharacterized protein LOC110029933 [Phalaenopsis equestris]|uniref:uncharacterized protein LOC110029933 n=1 Tax=Phalaenopsis equestris TaxID=78828 RepID=UPI0009E4DA3E|nr:uncharacterized protein LOC110029933 [Phalaenopsis equestris]